MDELSNRVAETRRIPPWPTVSQVGDLHPDGFVHDGVRILGTVGGAVERSVREGRDWRTRLNTPEAKAIVYQLWPMYLLAAHQVRLLLPLYPLGQNHNAWEGNPDAVLLDLGRLSEAEGLYTRRWGTPMQEYMNQLVQFMHWPR